MFFETLMQMPPFSVELLTHMNNIYQLDKIGNSEIKCKWHLLALSSNFAHIIPHVVEFVTSIGRMKFVRPIYKALAKVDLQLAKDTFVKTRSFYHPICAKMVAQDLCIN